MARSRVAELVKKKFAWKAKLIVGAVLALVMVMLLPMLMMMFLVSADQSACNGSGPAAAAYGANGVPQTPVAGYSPAQMELAAVIMKAAKDSGLTKRDQQIGIMTAMGESTLTNLDHGPTPSSTARGIFQQLDNGAWGSLQDRMDPYRASMNFYKALAAVTDRDNMAPTLVAHAVQRNEDPQHYAKYWDAAGQVLQALAGATTSAGQSTATPSSSFDYRNPVKADGVTYNYPLPNVQPHVVDVAHIVGPRFGIKTIGGWRPSDGYDMEAHPAGLALDFMTDDAGGEKTGDALAAYVREHGSVLNVKYIIWKQRVWVPGNPDWIGMEDRGNRTQNHFDHVHVSFMPAGQTAYNSNIVTNGKVGNCAHSSNVAMTSYSGPITPGGWVIPAQGTMTSPYGPRVDPLNGGTSFHDGTDFSGGCGAAIYAAHDGTVIQAGPAPREVQGLANSVTIDHGSNITTIYGHMKPEGVLVKAGDAVKAGQLIARQGSEGMSTGCHVHFMVEEGGRPIDSTKFLHEQGVQF